MQVIELFPARKMKYLTQRNYNRRYVTRNADIDGKKYLKNEIENFYIGLSSIFETKFIKSNFNHGDFVGVAMDDCCFEDCEMRNIEFYDCHITDCIFNNIQAESIKFFGCLLYHVEFKSCKMENISFRRDNVGHKSSLQGTMFVNTDISMIDFGDSEFTV